MAKRFIILLLIPALAQAGPEEEATKQATLAAYKQFGLEATLNDFVNVNIPKDYRNAFERIQPLLTTLINKRIYLTWTY